MDKDGTLFNYAEVWGPVIDKAVCDAFASLGVKEDKLDKLSLKLERLIGIDRNGINYKGGILFRPGRAPLIILKLIILMLLYGLNPFKVIKMIQRGFEVAGEMMKEDLANREFPGIKDLFEKLKERKYYIGIVTNDDVETTRCFLKRMGVTELVDFVRGKGSECKTKPNAEAFRQFLKEFSLCAEDVAVIGDARGDMKFARNAKAGYTVAVLTGSGDKKMLKRYADAIYPTILDITEDKVLFG